MLHNYYNWQKNRLSIFGIVQTTTPLEVNFIAGHFVAQKMHKKEEKLPEYTLEIFLTPTNKY